MRVKINSEKLSAWALTFIMVLSLVVVPAKPVAADTSSSVTAKLLSTGTNNEYWKEYNYSITNGLDTAISGIEIKVPATGTVNNVEAYGCSARYSDGYIIISHYAVVAAGATYTCPDDVKFGVGGNAVLGTPVVEYVEGEDSGGTSGSSLDYELTGQKKDISFEDTPFGKHGKLRLSEVEGYTAPIIVDKNDAPYQLRGASTHGMHWNEMHPYVNKDSFQSLRDEWGVNTVRLVSYVTQGGYTAGSKDFLDTKIQEGVKAATELGMYVIIDWHIHGESPIPTKASAEAFFEKYAKMYKDYDNVIFEICNEPLKIEWYNSGSENLYSYCKDIVKIIRDNGSDALIVCGTNTYSQDVDDVAKKPLKDDGYDNILYTFHFYSGSHYDNLMNKVKTATAAGTPIFVTEFGICDASGNGGYDLANADRWIALCDQYNISYSCWSLCNKDESASYLIPSCSKTKGGWLEEDLSTTGIWLVNTYRKHEEEEKESESSGKLENPLKADIPVLVTRTDKGITVKSVEGVEFSLDKSNWKNKNKDGIFSGLKPFTKYTVYARYSETETHKAGAVSEPLTVCTLVENPYVIDVSKFSGADAGLYLDALKESDEKNATVSYDSAKKELTLADKGKEYTLTGSNSGVTVNAAVGVGKITMKNAVIGALEVSDSGNNTEKADVALVVTGNNQIACGNVDNATAGVVMQPGDKLTVSGTGSLKIDKADGANNSVTGGTLVVESGNVTAEGTITTDAVTINGGSLDAASGIECSGDVAINGGTVKAPSIKVSEEGKIVIDPENANIVGDIADIFSKPPVDDEGKEIKIFTIKYVVETGSQTVRKNEGAGYTIDQEPPLKAGYTVTWIGSDGKAYKKGDVINVTGDITFTATYSQIMVGSVKISVPKTTLSIGDSVKAGVAVMPENALDRNVDWSSSNMQVVTVNENGVITANAAGTATITATASDGSGKTDAVSITVVAANPNEGIAQDEDIIEATSMNVIAKVKGAESITVKSAYKLAVKKTMQLVVSFMPENAEKEELSYTSSKPAVATISDSGMVTAKKAGTTTITIKAANGLTKTFKLQVMSKPVTKVKITGAKTSMKVKGTMKLKAVTSPNKSVASNNVCWTSSNAKIAIVDANGKVKALKKGTVKITVAVTDGSGKKATVKIKVK